MSQEAGITQYELQLLPEILRVVAEAAGVRAALRLVEERGGQWLYVPAEARPDHDMVPIVTLAGWQAMCSARPSEHLTVPMAVVALRAIRDRQMRADRSTASVNQLVKRYKISRRRVYQVMAEPCEQPADDQPDMFT